MTNHFEAKLHAFRRTQDGVVISYVVNPHDVSAEMATAALGTRYMIAFSEISDDERPVESLPHSLPINGEPSVAKLGDEPGNSGIAGAPIKDRRPFSNLRPSAQAGIRCGEKQFAWFLMDAFPKVCATGVAEGVGDAELVAAKVRIICRTDSRAQFDKAGSLQADTWKQLEKEYQSWLTDKNYKEAVRR